MAKIQDIDIPHLEFAEGAAPGTPASGIVRIYAKTDGKLYQKDDAGTETDLAGGGGSTVTTANAQMGATASLSATTYTTLTSVSLSAGTWDIWGWASLGNVPSASDQYAQLWDGSAQLSQHVVRNGNEGASDHVTIPTFAAGVVLGSTTTIYLRAYSDTTTDAYGSTALGTGGGSKIHARKIA